MRRHNINANKRNGMRRQFIQGAFSSHKAAKEFNVSRITSWKYMKEFERIREQFPDKLEDMNFYIPEPKRPHRPTPLYNELVSVLPILFCNETSPLLNPKEIWRSYKLSYPLGYCYTTFKVIFNGWLKENVTPPKLKLLYHIPDKDLKQLKSWRHSNNHRNWQIAVTLMKALEGATVMQIMEKADSIRKTVNGWINTYKLKGLKGLELPLRKTHVDVVQRMKDRKEKLIKLLHESPRLYGINRNDWSIVALTTVYNRLNNLTLTNVAISYTLEKMGYKFKKSRDMLTSQDPKFREKIAKIQSILQQLKPDEKFLSIDEYGPVSVKLKGGVMLKHKTEAPRAVPQKQKSKGLIICTAALELSTNQVTHFYSLKKNTDEMIKLLDILTTKYHDQKRIYLCWDAASWHNSNVIKRHITDHNKLNKPEVVLAPLPPCTQFLNVIESVFGGLARAVIHNSDYESVDKCKQAIDLHFQTRNKHFAEHPKRAGNKIWGKEVVAPRFSETQHCRNRNAMRGAS